MKINNTTARVHDLYQAAAQYITNTHRERCYQQLRQGETLEFRGMKLSQSQIEIGKEALSINQVAAVNIRGLTFTIHSTAQKHAWAIYQLKDVYNPWLFQDLVQRLSREQGNQP